MGCTKSKAADADEPQVLPQIYQPPKSYDTEGFMGVVGKFISPSTKIIEHIVMFRYEVGFAYWRLTEERTSAKQNLCIRSSLLVQSEGYFGSSLSYS